jgi:hypothetical protein
MLRPKRVIEIGSGFSSFVMLDNVNEQFLENSVHYKFIDPNTRRLRSRLSSDYSSVT